jgi:hypothetical protein
LWLTKEIIGSSSATIKAPHLINGTRPRTKSHHTYLDSHHFESSKHVGTSLITIKLTSFVYLRVTYTLHSFLGPLQNPVHTSSRMLALQDSSHCRAIIFVLLRTAGITLRLVATALELECNNKFCACKNYSDLNIMFQTFISNFQRTYLQVPELMILLRVQKAF